MPGKLSRCLERFAVIGRSGGGPHALACAALLPDRLTKAAVLVGLAPRGADGLEWFDAMTQSNQPEDVGMANGYAGLADPANLLTSLQDDVPCPDQRVVADRSIRSMLLQTYAEALRTSAHGWIDDALAFCSPWGFELATVTNPVLLWARRNGQPAPGESRAVARGPHPQRDGRRPGRCDAVRGAGFDSGCAEVAGCLNPASPQDGRPG